MRTLDDLMPSSVGLILGSGQNTGFTSPLFTKPRDHLLPTQFFSSIGQGLTAAIGAVVGSGKKPAFVVDGEASVLMYIAEFETAVRYNLPLLVVILNDQALGTEMHYMRAKGVDPDIAYLSTPNLGKVGRAMGGNGCMATNLERVRSAVREWLASPVPTILDVGVSDNVLSIPFSRMYYGEDH